MPAVKKIYPLYATAALFQQLRKSKYQYYPRVAILQSFCGMKMLLTACAAPGEDTTIQGGGAACRGPEQRVEEQQALEKGTQTEEQSRTVPRRG